MGAVKIPFITLVYLHISGTLASTGDDKDRWEPEFDGEILAYGGSLETLGTGAGDYLELQLRNSSLTPSKDYFTNKPTIEVNSATGLVEGGELCDAPQFWAGNVIHLDLDRVLAAANSANLHFWLLVQMYREVTL